MRLYSSECSTGPRAEAKKRGAVLAGALGAAERTPTRRWVNTPWRLRCHPFPHPHERRRQASHPRCRIQSQATLRVSHRDEVRVTNAAFGGPREPAVLRGLRDMDGSPWDAMSPLHRVSFARLPLRLPRSELWRKPLGTANSTRICEAVAVSAVCGASGETPITDGCTGTRQGPAARCHHSFWLRVYYKRRMCQPKGALFEKN